MTMREGLGRRLDYSRSLRKERVNTWERTDQLGTSAFTVLLIVFHWSSIELVSYCLNLSLNLLLNLSLKLSLNFVNQNVSIHSFFFASTSSSGTVEFHRSGPATLDGYFADWSENCYESQRHHKVEKLFHLSFGGSARLLSDWMYSVLWSLRPTTPPKPPRQFKQTFSSCR